MSFIDEHRHVGGVEPICAVLPIAPSTDYAWLRQRRDPSSRAARVQRDEVLRAAIRRSWVASRRLYGARKVWRELLRTPPDPLGVDGRVARCTVERLMRQEGLVGVVRGRRVRTTVPADVADRPLDRVKRDFSAPAPSRQWVADFTYAATWAGFVYVALVIDVFSRYIVGWRVTSTAPLQSPDLALDAREQALWARPTRDGLVHHSDRGVQSLSIRYSERLAAAGIEGSVGRVGDSDDDALAESVIGLYKTEVIRPGGLWKGLEEVELATLDWVHWFDNTRLLEPIGCVPRRSSNRHTTNVKLPKAGQRDSSKRVSDEAGAVQVGMAKMSRGNVLRHGALTMRLAGGLALMTGTSGCNLFDGEEKPETTHVESKLLLLQLAGAEAQPKDPRLGRQVVVYQRGGACVRLSVLHGRYFAAGELTGSPDAGPADGGTSQKGAAADPGPKAADAGPAFEEKGHVFGGIELADGTTGYLQVLCDDGWKDCLLGAALHSNDECTNSPLGDALVQRSLVIGETQAEKDAAVTDALVDQGAAPPSDTGTPSDAGDASGDVGSAPADAKAAGGDPGDANEAGGDR